MARELVVKLVGDDASLRRAFFRSSAGAKGFERDISRASRGALAGSGVFRSLGRSIAFASGGFLAFASAGQFLRKSVDAAKEAAVVQKQLEAQFRSSGKSLGDYQKQIDHTSNRLSLLAGFENDEVKSAFLTIFRTTGNVSKALRDTATAADLARAKHIGLAQAALIVAKTEAGNTTLLRRQGFAIAKNATSIKALAALRQIVAGQARSGTTEQERFGAVLHDTEEIIGTGLLPVLNKYLAAGAVWLTQMNESGDLQKNVAAAADAFTGAVSGVVSVVKTADKITGSFKNTLELLIGLKVASYLAGVASSVGLIGRSAETSAVKVDVLKASLKRLGALGVVAVAVEVVIHRKQVDNAVKSVQQQVIDAQKHSGFVKGLARGEAAVANAPGVKQTLGLFGVHNVTAESLLTPLRDLGKKTDSAGNALRLSAAKVARETTNFRETVVGALTKAQHDINAAARSTHFTAQGNSFFDNAISRILLRGGLGNISQQIGALRKADTLIAQRLAVTKDITRRLNLEDELLQNQAQIRSLTGQQTADRLQAAEDARQKALDALARRATARNAAQFKALGLTATGEARAPSVKQLRNALGTLSDAVKGTFLDTSKTASVFSRIRKVLSGNLGAVGRDVRLQIQQILGDLNQQIKKNERQRFHHANTNAILAGLGLSPEQLRVARARLSRIGGGGSVPGSRSLAFSAGTTVVHTHVHLDGDQVAHNVTRHQRKAQTRRADSRRGPYAGRN